MNRQELATIQAAMLAAVQAVATAHGVSIRSKGGTYSNDGGPAVAKFEIAHLDANGTAVSREARDFTEFAGTYGFAPDDLGRTFRHGGRLYTITGLKIGASRMPILARRDDGVGFKFPPTIRKALEAR